jgi:hypothetical protein
MYNIIPSGNLRKDRYFLGGYRSIPVECSHGLLNLIRDKEINTLELRVLFAYCALTRNGENPEFNHIRDALECSYRTGTLEKAYESIQGKLYKPENKSIHTKLPRTVLLALARKCSLSQAATFLIGCQQMRVKGGLTFHLNQLRMRNRLGITQANLCNAIKSMKDRKLLVKVFVPMWVLEQDGARYAWCCATNLRRLNLYQKGGRKPEAAKESGHGEDLVLRICGKR